MDNSEIYQDSINMATQQDGKE